MKKSVLVVGGANSYYPPFASFGPYTSNHKILDTAPETIGLVVFTGGEDVTPSVYGEKANRQTFNNPERDEFEITVFKRALELKLPMAGICRGSQFLCAMAGGKLVQHINSHGGYHNVRTDDGRLIEVSSTHHQNQIPTKDAVILAWAEPSRSKTYEGPDGVFYDLEKEYDCVYYPNIHAVCMQYHPEYMNKNSEGFKYSVELVKRFLIKD